MKNQNNFDFQTYNEKNPDGVFQFPNSWGSITLPLLIYFKEIQGIQYIKLLDYHASLLYKDGHTEYITLDKLAQRVYKYA